MHRKPLIATLALLAAPALANSLIAPGPAIGIAKSRFSATPDNEWNRLSARESKQAETWTLDGPQLNSVTFYGGVAAGEPLLRETDKKKPLPRVARGMLITDIPTLLESSYRAQGRVARFTVDAVEPADVGGHKGVRFTYNYIRTADDVERKGEAIGAMVGDALYLTTYEAPAIYFFDRDLQKFRQLAATLKM